MLEWLFSWLASGPAPTETVIEVPVFMPGSSIAAAGPAVGHLLYLGLRFGGNMGLFNPLWSPDGFEIARWRGFATAVSLNVEPLSSPGYLLNLGLQPEIVAAVDLDDGTFSLTFPLLLRGTFRPSGGAFVSPLLGLFVFVPVGSGDVSYGHASESFLWGRVLGLSLGGQLGPGRIFTDMRISTDMFSSRVRDFYRRSEVNVAIGFEMGLVPKRAR
jgi:hypothetical protein